MGEQGVRQAARSTVREALDARQQQRLEQEKRQAGWAVDLLTALADGMRWSQVHRTGGGRSGAERCSGTGLDAAGIAALCGDRVDVKEITGWRNSTGQPDGGQPERPASSRPTGRLSWRLSW